MEIQSFTDDKVSFRMMANTTTFFMGDIEIKTLGLKIKKDISIPRVEHANEKQRFIRERIIGLNIFIIMGMIKDKFHKNQGIFSPWFSLLPMMPYNHNCQ
jgi:hypothetical protein